MLTFYAVVFVLLVVETVATLIFGMSSEMERAIARKQSTWDRETVWAHLNIVLRVALRAALGILLAIRIVELTG
ncbi:hypothetical protein [Hwanghaeella sp.]|uniref:hypothetical protein n=1 Tax=Hwanghaeella sp. TaxID=2605943 RepID=UPI003CCBDBCC